MLAKMVRTARRLALASSGVAAAKCPRRLGARLALSEGREEAREAKRLPGESQPRSFGWA